MTMLLDEPTTQLEDIDYDFQEVDMQFDSSVLDYQSMELDEYEPVDTKKVDWSEVHRFYLTNPTSSYRDLSEEFGVSLKQVKKHGSRDGYVDSRQRVTNLTKTKIEEKLADERVEANERHAEMYRQIQDLIYAQLEIITTNMELLCEQAKAEGRIPKDKELYSSAKLLALTKALTTAINGERVCLGLPIAIAPVPVGWKPPEAENPELANMPFVEQLEYLLRETPETSAA